MDYFSGLDISMDETHVCVLDREGVVARESKTESTAEAIACELAKAPTCRRIVFETGRMAPILFHGLNQLVSRWSASRADRPTRRSSHLPPTRPTAMTREGWRIWPGPASSNPCM